MRSSLRHRLGFTLIELLIAVTIIGVLYFIGATMFRMDDVQKTREAGFDVVQVFQQARYNAARQNRAVVVQVELSTSTTRGSVRALLGTNATCGQVIPASPPDCDPATPTFPCVMDEMGIDFDADYTGVEEVGPGIAWIVPTNQGLAGTGTSEGFCIRPNGRIVRNNLNGSYIPASNPNDIAGNATVAVQWNPVRATACVDANAPPTCNPTTSQQLIVPYTEVEVPFNGLVRVPQ